MVSYLTNMGVGRPSKQSAGRTVVLSTIHTGTEMGKELKSSPQRSHPHVVTTVLRPGQGGREGPINRGSPRDSGDGLEKFTYVSSLLSSEEKK